MKKTLLFLMTLFLVSFVVAQNAPEFFQRSAAGASKASVSQPVQIQAISSSPIKGSFYEDVESHTDFTVNSTVNGWSYYDLDGSITYGFESSTFPNDYDPMAYIVFNPGGVEPSMAGQSAAEPMSGEKYFACFAAVMPADGGQGPNNDWLISPELTGPTMFGFWAKTYHTLYGLERIKVAYSTTGTAVSDFIFLSEAPYLAVPLEWTYYAYDLPVGTKYVAINCVSNDAFILMIDDLEILDSPLPCDPPAILLAEYTGECAAQLSWEATPGATAYKIYRDGSVIVENHPEATYLDAGFDPQATHEWSVAAVCSDQESSTIKRSLPACQQGVTEKNLVEFKIVPNPAHDNITITAGASDFKVEILNFLGQTVISYPNIDSEITLDISSLNNGVYFVRIASENETIVKKFIKQ